MSALLPAADSLRLIGVSHRTAPVSLRERLAFRAGDLPAALGKLLARGCREAAILSTCNRVEITAVARDKTVDLSRQVRAFLADYHGVPESLFASALYDFGGLDAVRHLFEVTASLDSQILGETEILAQSKEAFRAAAEFGSCGPVLQQVFERSFFLSKQIRSDDGIGRQQASVSSAAVALARKVFEVKNCRVLVMGTGEMATGIVKTLRAAGAGEILVVSRTPERAAHFAKAVGATPAVMDHLPEYLAQVDLVLVSTAAGHYMLRPEHIRAAAARRHGRVLCLIDISVPRNVDPAVANLGDTFLYDIDDLEEVAREGRAEREAVAARWQPRLANEAETVLLELQTSGVDQTVQKLLRHASQVRQEVLKQTHTAQLDSDAIAVLERALERLQGRLLHGPLETLRRAVREGDGSDASTWVTRLFQLEIDEAKSLEAREKAAVPEKQAAPAPPVLKPDSVVSVPAPKRE